MSKKNQKERSSEIQPVVDSLKVKLDAAWARFNEAMKNGDEFEAENASVDLAELDTYLHICGRKYDPKTGVMEYVDDEEENSDA